jgi:hypothetical protein
MNQEQNVKNKLKLEQQAQEQLQNRITFVIESLRQNQVNISTSIFFRCISLAALELVDELLPESAILTSNNPNPNNKAQRKKNIKLDLARAVKHFENDITLYTQEQQSFQNELKDYGLIKEEEIKPEGIVT